jgi:hypothetical protein
VLLTDHDTLEGRRRGEEGWHGPVLVLVGEEVTPPDQNHFLAFGIDREIRHRDLSPAEICRAVEDAGGFGFAAHPFSRGSQKFRRMGPGYPWRDLDTDALRGIELWSFLTDTAERFGSVNEALRFVARPGRGVDHPPERNVREWDRMLETRPVVAIGGLDAHQFGIRVRGRVPIRLMAYHRSFRHLRTHVLCERAPTGDLAPDREQVYGALRSGRCYLAMDSLAPARGFAFWGDGPDGSVAMGGEADGGGDWRLKARAPRAARLRMIRAGATVAEVHGAEIELAARQPGAYRVEARLEAHGRERTWIVSNPIYLR